MHDHKPILVNEVVNMLIKDKDGIYIDCTVGFGGHAFKILNNISKKGFLIGMDLDPYALKKAKEKLADSNKKFSLYNITYKDFPKILKSLKIEKVNGFLLDLGISSYQVNSAHRGFSFMNEGPLDMRFNPKKGISAKNLLKDISENKLISIIKQYGEEPQAKKIAKHIIKRRNDKKLNTTFDLKKAIINATKSSNYKTFARVFQALRIAVNNELDDLKITLKYVTKYLKSEGRIAIISFHSLEDRIVKHFFKNCTIIDEKDYYKRECISDKKFNVITKKPILSSIHEITNNPRARSAKLRIAERI